MRSHIAWLRGINVGGKNRVPMKALVEVCSKLGWTDIQTLLQTGNVAFQSAGTTRELEVALEQGILERFGFAIPVMVREATEYGEIVEASPFEAACVEAPSRVLLFLSQRPIKLGCRAELEGRANSGEIVVATDQALWIYFPNGIGTSKLTSALIDRAAGSTATGRNWNTVCKIRDWLVAA